MSTRTRPVRKATVNARYVTDGTYPDGPPVSALERAVHKLNRESFRSNVLAYVDNILVRALFTSKKRYHSSKAMELSMVGTLGCLPSECTDMARLINGGIVDRQDPSPEQCRQAAQRLQEAFPHVFGEEHRRPLEQ